MEWYSLWHIKNVDSKINHINRYAVGKEHHNIEACIHEESIFVKLGGGEKHSQVWCVCHASRNHSTQSHSMPGSKKPKCQFGDQLNQSEQYLFYPEAWRREFFKPLKHVGCFSQYSQTIKQEIFSCMQASWLYIWCALPTVYLYTLLKDPLPRLVPPQVKHPVENPLHTGPPQLRKKINNHITHPASASTLTKETRLTYDMVRVGPQNRGRQPKGTCSLHLQKFCLKSYTEHHTML